MHLILSSFSRLTDCREKIFNCDFSALKGTFQRKTVNFIVEWKYDHVFVSVLHFYVTTLTADLFKS